MQKVGRMVPKREKKQKNAQEKVTPQRLQSETVPVKTWATIEQTHTAVR